LSMTDAPGNSNLPTAISADIPDWTREYYRAFSWNPPRALLQSIRDYQNATGLFAGIKRKYAVLRHRFWSVVTGADIPVNAKIGGGLLIPHPNGIVIHPDAQIGVNCLLFQQVTIGANDRGFPILGGHVDVGAGAKILGPVHIGDHARIGANAVVLIDVPPHGVAVGNPARIVSDGG
jgi:serine O-acetyltransferase